MKDAKGHGSEKRGGDGGTKLTPVGKIPSYAVIIRSIHERGAAQKEALTELDRRGLYLSADQKVQAGLGDSGWQHGSLVSGGQPVASNAHAAATLAGGPKSASVDTHPAMKDWAGRTDADLEKDYGGPVRHYDGKK